MILNDAVISNLLERTQESETSISSHWRAALEQFHYGNGEFAEGAGWADGHTARTSFLSQFRQYAFLAPFQHMGRSLGNFKEYQRTGQAIAKRRGGQFDLAMMRQVLTLSILTKYLPSDQMRLPIVVIGDGWGAMASLVLSCLPEANVVLVNLTRMLLVDLVYIRKAMPDVAICLASDADEYQSGLESDDVRVIAVCADDSEIIGCGPIRVAINIVSMQEMDPPVIGSYFASLRSSPNPTTFFYCCNRIEKTLPDDTVVRFEDYPWRPDDEVLLDELCPWHQYYLRLRPPFHGRYDGPVWHRLARMNKDQ
jgi:putative sugar O-methyltransferase